MGGVHPTGKQQKIITILDSAPPTPIEYHLPEDHLLGGVSERLELDVAHLVVARVGLEVHVAGHIEVDPRRIPKHAVPES